MPLDTALLDEVTRNHFEPGLVNQIYDSFVLWNRLKTLGRQETLVGPRLEWLMVSKKHESIGLISGYEETADQQIKPTTKAIIEPAMYYASVGISDEEEMKNSGSMEQLVSILKTQIDNARETLTERIAQDAYGSGAAIGGKYPIIGLGAAIDNDNTYANINRSTAGNEFWKGNVDANAHSATNLQDATHASYLPRILRASYTNATHGGSPDLGITTKAIYNLYMDIAGTKINTFKDMADLGFGGAEFMGGAHKMAFDDYCTALAYYMLNTKDWSLHTYAGKDFNSDGWARPTKQLARVTHFVWAGQLKCEAPRRQAALTAITAP